MDYHLYTVRHIASGMMYVGVTTMTLHNRMLAHKGDGPMSALLKEGLVDAPLGEARDLGPAVLRYLDRVRSEQPRP